MSQCAKSCVCGEECILARVHDGPCKCDEFFAFDQMLKRQIQEDIKKTEEEQRGHSWNKP